MAETTLPVEHVMNVELTTSVASLIGNAPLGTRVVVGGEGGTFEGPKVKGTIHPPGGDWVTVRADGNLALDVRLLLRTDDGADILMTYTGIGLEGGAKLRTTPRFETGDERYAWLNAVQCVGLGATGENSVSYEVYAVL